MYIHIGLLRSQLALRKHLPIHNLEVGSIIKHQRIERSLTLEETAEGICSVSYLSKVENNLIVPSKKYINLFEEKFQVNLGEKPLGESELILEKLVDYLFYEERLVLDEKVFIGFDYRSKLYHFGYLVTHDEYNEAKKMYFELTPYIKNLSNIEIFVYLYLTSWILKQEGRIKDAFIVLNLMDTTCPHQKLRTIINKDKINLATQMNNHPFILLNYDKHLEHLMTHEYYHIVHDQKFKYIVYLSQFISPLDLRDLLEKVLHINAHQKNYILARHDYLNMRYKECYQQIVGKEKLNLRYYVLTLQVLNKLELKDQIRDLLMIPFETENIHVKLMIEYINLKHLTKRPNQAAFIKNELLKIHDLPDTIDLLHFWYEEGMEVFKEQGFYKDATTLGQLIYRKIKDLSTNMS